MASPNRVRVLYPWKHCTPIPHEVIEEVLPLLKFKRSGALYLHMFDLAWHSRGRRFAASPTDLARDANCDFRTVERCLSCLLDIEAVDCIHLGTARSRADKPEWRVPLAEFNLRRGSWTPVPRFLIADYLPRFSGALLLLVLLRVQHYQWLNHCWPGVTYLAKKTGWSPRAVYDALHVMGHQLEWERLKTGLPWPLNISWHPTSNGGQRRHFTVRAVFYQEKERGRGAVNLTREFAEHFGIWKGHPVDSDFKI